MLWVQVYRLVCSGGNEFWHALDIPLREQQFRVEDSAPCRATDCIVRKGNKFHVQDRALAQSSNSRRHATPRLTIPAWLRTISLVGINQDGVRYTGQMAGHHVWLEARPRFTNSSQGRFALKAY